MYRNIVYVRTFITGHRGLLGRALMTTLPHHVQPIVATRDELDLQDELKVSRFIEVNHVDSVILSAARVGGIVVNSNSKHQFLLENLKIQNSVISASMNCGVRNLIFIGSSCVYPSDATPPFSESMLGHGAFEVTNEGYAIAKFAGIKLCQAISIEKKVNFSSLIPCNLYGPYDNFNLHTAHVIPALIRKFVEARDKNAKQIEIMGDGNARREFLFSEDLARAIWFFSMKDLPGGTLNVGAGSEISIRNLTSIIANIIDYRGEILFTNSGLNGVKSKLMNSDIALSMGWKPSTSIEEGIIRTVAWFEENRIEQTV